MEKSPLHESLARYSVVLVEYFSGEHLVRCIHSLRIQTHAPEKIVVVLNGIGDKERTTLYADFPEVQVIDPHSNLGYARAANLGIANTSSPIVLTLNPDTELDAYAAQVACEYMSDHEGVGTVGPKIQEPNGAIYPSAREEPSLVDAIGHAFLGTFFPSNRFTKKYKNIGISTDDARDVGWLSGAALFIRRDALDDVGGWDEDYFMYCEDIDLGRKMRLNRWRNVYVPNSRVVHVGGVSTSRTPIVLLLHHHRSLYTYASKKFDNNPLMKALTLIFIAIRLPIALVAHFLRIN